jgi:multidrug efflux pump
MFWPVTASTATILAAFLPLLFWPGVVGQFMQYLPITLVATLIAALIMAMIFVPVIGAMFGRTGVPVSDEESLERGDLSKVRGRSASTCACCAGRSGGRRSPRCSP